MLNIIYEILAHEYKHASDFSNMCRVKEGLAQGMTKEELYSKLDEIYSGTKDFYQKSVRRGQFEKDSNIGKFFQKIDDSVANGLENPNYHDELMAVHDSFLHEERAIRAGNRELQKFVTLIDKLREFLMKG